jgi:hypothetical protein
MPALPDQANEPAQAISERRNADKLLIGIPVRAAAKEAAKDLAKEEVKAAAGN